MNGEVRAKSSQAQYHPPPYPADAADGRGAYFLLPWVLCVISQVPRVASIYDHARMRENRSKTLFSLPFLSFIFPFSLLRTRTH